MAEHAERWLHKHLIFGRLMEKLGFSMKNLIFRYRNGKSWFFNLKYLVFQSKSDFHIEKLGFFYLDRSTTSFDRKIRSSYENILGFSERCDKWLPNNKAFLCEGSVNCRLNPCFCDTWKQFALFILYVAASIFRNRGSN